MFRKIYNKIVQYDTIIIHRHAKPDGDALGAQLGLKQAILDTFPTKVVLAVGDESELYHFLEPMDDVADETYANALVIVVDSGSVNLISDKRFSSGKYLIKIDHHIAQGEYGDMSFVDTSYESCCSIIAHFIKETKMALSKKAAEAIFLGMVTDSGRFRFKSTTSRTFDMASFLMTKDIDIDKIYNNIYIDELANVRLRAKMMDKFVVLESGVAYLINTYDEVLAYNANVYQISRGMVNIMAGIRNINIWATFTENEDGKIYVELRSNGKNINTIATSYGGGGHLQASGATVESFEQVKEIIEKLEKLAEE